jgi:fatty-acyl-CoA synthase
MTDREHMPAASKVEGLLCYEDLIEGQDDRFDWPTFDENAASSLCYTSGTTGNPKGALYSHRSTVLHTFAIAMPMRSTARPATPSFRWCRCSTSTPGACRTPPA